MDTAVLKPKRINLLVFFTIFLFILSIIFASFGKMINIRGHNTYFCLNFIDPFGIEQRIIPDDSSIYQTSMVYMQCRYSPWATILYDWFVVFMGVLYWVGIRYVYKRFVEEKHVLTRSIFDIIILFLFPIFIVALFVVGSWILTYGSTIMANA